MSSLADRARQFTWVSYGVLLVQQIAEVWSGGAPWIIWLFHLLPLLMFLPGMLKDNLRSFIWLCFVCLGYFMHLVVAVFAQPDNWLVITGLVAVVVLFNAAMLYVRWRARELRSRDETATGD